MSNNILVNEWHPTLNGTLRFEDMSPSSARKVWWRCGVNDRHEWKTFFFARSKQNQKCPFCQGKKVLPEDSIAVKYPHLLEEWDAEKNPDLDIFKLSCSSGKKAWWKCGEGHSWKASVVHRTSGRRDKTGTGCPYCSNQAVCFENSLAATGLPIVAEWHPTKNGNLTPADVVAGSPNKVWWKCPKSEDHEWLTSPRSRVSKDTGCPCCLGRKLVASNCLATTHPKVAAEWHPDKNDFGPESVTYATNKRVWWQCANDPSHEWSSLIYVRGRGAQCPFCASSKGEKAIRDWLLAHNLVFQREYRLDDCRDKRPLPFDFAVFRGNMELVALIEYQGRHHYMALDYFGGQDRHEVTVAHDKIKDEYCVAHGIPLLKIHQDDLNRIEPVLKEFFLGLVAARRNRLYCG